MRTATSTAFSPRCTVRPTVRLTSFLATVAVVLAACGGSDKSITGPTNLSGDVYKLSRVDANVMPYVVTGTEPLSPSGTLTYSYGIKAGAIALQDGGKFAGYFDVVDKQTSTNPSAAQSYDSSKVAPFSGTYTLSGSAIRLITPDTSETGAITPRALSGTKVGTRITLADTSISTYSGYTDTTVTQFVFDK